LRKIPVLDDFTIDLKPLEQQITADRANGYHPICVVGNAGTINTGAVDPLDALAEFCPTHGLWFHVDVAYGGPAARTQSPRHCSEGHRADSVVINPHKWLYVPVEASCMLVRQPTALRDTFHLVADYLQTGSTRLGDEPVDFKDYGPQLSRSFRALKVWMTFKAYGRGDCERRSKATSPSCAIWPIGSTSQRTSYGLLRFHCRRCVSSTVPQTCRATKTTHTWTD
jgi:aromatic-L-amino-acid/L-tryptophan decarboxylase